MDKYELNQPDFSREQAGDAPASVPQPLPGSEPAETPAPQSIPGPQAVPGPQSIPGPQAVPGPQAIPGPQSIPGPQAMPGPQAIPGQQMPVNGAGYAGYGGQSIPYVDPNQQAKPSGGGIIARILIGLGVAFLVIYAMGTLVAALTLRSCIREVTEAATDVPIHENAEVKSFIEDPRATDRDLEVFDALRGKVDSIYKARTGSSNYDPAEDPIITPEQLRKAIAEGSWPQDSGYRDPSYATSPQLWVRLAQMAQDHLAEVTGESWDVVDLSYPFPSNGPIPWPAHRDEEDTVTVSLVCSSGQDEGLEAQCIYWRWANPEPYFTDTVALRRSESKDYEQRLAEISSGEVLAGRSYVWDPWGYLYVWADGADDPLLDTEAFLAFAKECIPYVGDWGDIVLLESDTPAMLSWSHYGGDYANSHPDMELSREEAQRQLILRRDSYDFDYAYNDCLLRVVCKEGDVKAEDLEGTLSGSEPYARVVWTTPDESYAFDEDLVSRVCENTGAAPEQVVAMSSFEEKDAPGTDIDEVEKQSFIVLARGTVPEDPTGFCTLLEQLREAEYRRLVDEHPDMAGWTVSMRIYVVDESMLSYAESGEAASFAQLREATVAAPASLSDFACAPVLSAWPYISSLGDEPDPTYTSGTEKSEIDGHIAHSREWMFDEAA